MTRVFTFWTGPQSAAIRLCLRSIERNCPGSECWTLDRFYASYDGRLGPWEAVARQRPNVQSDVLRAWLLTTYGGIWIDADFIAFRDLRPLWQHIEAGADLVTYHVPATRVCTALMVARQESIIMHEQCRRIRQKLKRKKVLGPMSLGPSCFARVIDVCQRARVRWLPFRLIHPRPWWTMKYHRDAMRSQQPYEFHPRAFGFMLTHKALNGLGLSQAGEAEILADRSPVGQAFRKALEVS